MAKYMSAPETAGRCMAKVFCTVLAVVLGVVPVSGFADHLQDHVRVKVGVLSPQALQGQEIFNANCAKCHGENGAGGTHKGPPLIHDIYNPGHHGNQAFYSAVHNGARAHHWPFGDMPAQPQVGFSEMPLLIRFIREVQEQNGIVRREHRM